MCRRVANLESIVSQACAGFVCAFQQIGMESMCNSRLKQARSAFPTWVASRPAVGAMSGNQGRKQENRAAREAAVKQMSDFAADVGVKPIHEPASASEVEKFYKGLCAKVSVHNADTLVLAGNQWCDHGGLGALYTAGLEKLRMQDKQADIDAAVHSHKKLEQGFYGHGRGAFRLQSKAFMLTFNSSSFEDCPIL